MLNRHSNILKITIALLLWCNASFISASRYDYLVTDMSIDDATATINVYMDDDLAKEEFTEKSIRKIYKQTTKGVRKALPKEYRHYEVRIYVRGVPIESLLETVEDQAQQQHEEQDVAAVKQNKKHRGGWWGNISYDGQPWTCNVSKPLQPTAALSSKHISLWQSHGRYYDLTKGFWKWQRPLLYGTTEDLFTQTIVVPYLIPMLENAGAIVFTPRERDWQTEEVIVDNDGGGYYERNGKTSWRKAPVSGFAIPEGDIHDNYNPFEQGTVRLIETDRNSNAGHAVYQPSFRKTGRYAVYVSYATVNGSVDDAVYSVIHQGICTNFRVNQKMGGGTWVYLGSFTFDAGCSELNCVILSARSEKKGVVTTDAVRFGGGMGNIRRGYTTSGMPRCDEGARYYAQWAGMPYNVYSSKERTDDYGDDINARCLMAKLLSGGSCYVPDTIGRGVPLELSLAIHSDAGYTSDGKTHTGTLAVCTTYLNDSILSTGRTRLASRDLADDLLSTIPADIQRKYGSWQRRELWDRNYSESRWPEVPSAILETMSHQNFADMRMAQDPNFKFDFARSIYKTLLRYVSRMHDTDYTVSPLTPNRLRVEITSDGEALLSWNIVEDPDEPTAKPTGFVVYTAIGKGGFDNGHYVKGHKGSVKLDIEPGQLYSFRVTAVNDGGESFPSEVVSAFYVPEAQKSVLIVNGFHRLSSPAVRDNSAEQGFDIKQDAGVTYGPTAGWYGYQTNFNKANMGKSLGATNDSLVGQIIAGNDFDYIRTHAEAIASTQRYSIASCSVEALEKNEVRPTLYNMVDLILGLEKNDGWSLQKYQAFSQMLRQHLQLFTSRGGALLVSGSYVGADMQMPSDRKYLEQVMKCSYQGTNTDSLARDTIQGLGQTFTFHRQLNDVHYAATHPDVLQPVAPAFSAMIYADGYPACVAYDGTDYKAMSLGFPFECIKEEHKREVIMKGILRFLLQTQ